LRFFQIFSHKPRFPGWHLSLGSGFTLFYACEKTDTSSVANSSSDSMPSISAFVSNAQAWINFRLGERGVIFLGLVISAIFTRKIMLIFFLNLL